MIDRCLVARAENEDLDDFDYDEEHVELESDIGEYGTSEDDDDDLDEPDTLEQSVPSRKPAKTDVREPASDETAEVETEKTGDTTKSPGIVSGLFPETPTAGEQKTPPRKPMKKAKSAGKPSAGRLRPNRPRRRPRKKLRPRKLPPRKHRRRRKQP
jgi:hypothetical protein